MFYSTNLKKGDGKEETSLILRNISSTSISNIYSLVATYTEQFFSRDNMKCMSLGPYKKTWPVAYLAIYNMP